MDTLLKVKHALLAMQRRPWEQGVAMQSLLAIGDIDTATLMARDAINLQSADGRLAMMEPVAVVTDPAAAGEAILALAQLTGDAIFAQAAQRMVNYLLDTAPRAADGTLLHLTTEPQIWIDSLYMAPPLLALAGHYNEALRQIDGMRSVLWDATAHLFSHIYDAERRQFVRADFWGVGNGWAAAGLLRVSLALPDAYAAQRAMLLKYLNEVIEGCLAWQRDDGLFHDVVNRPETFVETNLAQMLAYTIYRGISAGMVSATFRPYADRMRAAAHQQVDVDGFVQGVCGAPNFDRPGIAVEGQAFFLFMEAAFAASEQPS